MNIDKTIKELTNRLDVVSPAFSNGIRDDGINYWKDKRIISAKQWNEIYEKNSTYTDTYKITLTSRKPLQYFPDDYNGSISASEIIDEKLKEEIQNWNIDYYELLEYRKNSTLGKMKCSKCLLSGSNDDPIFIGIEKVFARIVISNHCNDNAANNYSEIITYHCNVMNIFSCPLERKEDDHNSRDDRREKSKYPYKIEDLFALQRVAFTIEQAISTFFEITKQNEIIYEVDCVNDRVQEIHTKYNGEAESWGWQENVKDLLLKVKPISNIVIRNNQDIHNILTDGEKLNFLLEQYGEQQQNKNKEIEYQVIKDNKDTIINFILENKNSIKVDDLKISEPVYKCYRKEKGKCSICNIISNIMCINCNNHIWLCTNHWQEHITEKHIHLI